MTDDREIKRTERHEFGRVTVFHEWDKTGCHRLRATDRIYKPLSPNRFPKSDWVPENELAILVLSGGEGNILVGTNNYNLPPVFLVIPIGEPEAEPCHSSSKN